MKLSATLFLILLPLLAFSQEHADTSYKDYNRMTMRTSMHTWIPTGKINRGKALPGISVQIGGESYKDGALLLGIERGFNLKKLEQYTDPTSGPVISYRFHSTTALYVSYEYHAIKSNRWVFYPGISAGINLIALDNKYFYAGGALSIDVGTGVKYFFQNGLLANFKLTNKFLIIKDGIKYANQYNSLRNLLTVHAGIGVPLSRNRPLPSAMR